MLTVLLKRPSHANSQATSTPTSWDLVYFILYGNSDILEHNRFGFFETSVIKPKVIPWPASYSGIHTAGSSPGSFPMQPIWKEGKAPGRETEKVGRCCTEKLRRYCSRVRGSRQVFKISMFLITEKISSVLSYFLEIFCKNAP